MPEPDDDQRPFTGAFRSQLKAIAEAADQIRFHCLSTATPDEIARAMSWGSRMDEYETAVDLASYMNVDAMDALRALRVGAVSDDNLRRSRGDFGRTGKAAVVRQLRRQDQAAS
jgi:hypothetical protein